MKMLMRVIIPAEVLAAPDALVQWRALLKSIGALASHPREEGRIQPMRVSALACSISDIRWLEFWRCR